MPRLPRKVKVDVTKCHACPAKMPRKVEVHVAKCHACHAISATPATQSEGGQVVCGQVVKVDKLCVDKLRVRKLCVDKL